MLLPGWRYGRCAGTVETAHPAETLILGPLYLSPSISSGAQERGLLLTRKERYTSWWHGPRKVRDLPLFCPDTGRNQTWPMASQ